MNLIISALCEGNRTLAIMLIQKATLKEVNEFDEKNQQAPIHIALRKGYLDVVQALINSGANINAMGSDPIYTDMTPLHYAALNNNLPAVELLLLEGANIHLQNGNSYTAASLALQHGFAHIARTIDQYKYEFLTYPYQRASSLQHKELNLHKNPLIEGFYRKILELQQENAHSVEMKKWLTQEPNAQKLQGNNVIDFMSYRRRKLSKKY